MKQGIHPTYYHDVKVTCACGNEIITGSVLRGPLKVDVCSACHPFFTGEQRLVDTEGMVEKFERRKKEAREKRKQTETKARVQKKGDVKKRKQQPRTLREMLEQTGK